MTSAISVKETVWHLWEWLITLQQSVHTAWSEGVSVWLCAIPALFRTSDKYSGIFHILIREWIINSMRLLCCIFRCKESKIIWKYSIQWTVKCSQIETPLTNNKLQWLSSHMNSSSCFLRKWYQNDTSASYPPAMTGLVKLFIQPSENAICAPFLHGIKLASSS